MLPAQSNARQPRGRTTHTPDGQFAFELSEVGMLGSGAHGIVRAAMEVKSGKWFAIKVMPASVLGAVAKELIALKRVDHPNIVKLHGTQVDLDKKRVYMIMVCMLTLRVRRAPIASWLVAMVAALLIRAAHIPVLASRSCAAVASSSIALPNVGSSMRRQRVAT